jgi:hypothetical protein
MFSHPRSTLALFALLALGVTFAPSRAWAQSTVGVNIFEPTNGAVIEEPRDAVYLQGRAFAQGVEAPAFDIALVIDSSGSTRAPAGVDVNGNGVVGRKSSTRVVISIFGVMQDSISDPGDSVLAAEVRAAKKLLSQLDPRSSRVAIISFAGDYLPGTGHTGNQTFLANSATPDAFLEQPLTSNFNYAFLALDNIERNGPNGGTNIAEGLRLAVSELSGLAGSGSSPRRGAKKVVLLLTDGIPTFPVGSATTSDPEDIRASVSAAEVAGRFGIQVHTFALGREALSEPYTVKEVARVTGGRFTPVPDPADILTVLPGINLIDLDRIQVANLTTGQKALRVSLGADGTFRALVPVKDGLNRLQATAYATNGISGRDAVSVNFRKLPSEDKRQLELARQDDLDLELEKAMTDKLKLDLERLKKESLDLELEKARQEQKRLEQDLERARAQRQLEEMESRRRTEEERLRRQREAALESIEEAERQETDLWTREQERREKLELELEVEEKDKIQ